MILLFNLIYVERIFSKLKKYECYKQENDMLEMKLLCIFSYIMVEILQSSE